MAKTIVIGWSDLNDSGKEKVAKAYGYDTPAEFEAAENYDLYPCLIGEVGEDDPLLRDEYECDDEDDEDEDGNCPRCHRSSCGRGTDCSKEGV
jgi:hypothetical protein